MVTQTSVIETKWWHKLDDLDRYTLRPVSLVDCIEYEMHLRGSLPTLYSLEGRVIGRFRSRSIRLYGKYLQEIRHLSYLNRSFSIFKILLIALRYTPTRAKHRRPWSYGLDLPWWCGPCLVIWILGGISPTDFNFCYGWPIFWFFGLFYKKVNVFRPFSWLRM